MNLLYRMIVNQRRWIQQNVDKHTNEHILPHQMPVYYVKNEYILYRKMRVENGLGHVRMEIQLQSVERTLVVLRLFNVVHKNGHVLVEM